MQCIKTVSPTAAPTPAPTEHICRAGGHGCDKYPGGVCVVLSEAGEWKCGCEDDYIEFIPKSDCALLSGAP